MAAPHVAGVAALVKEGITEPDEVFSVLMKSARVFQDDTLNHFGAGHLDAAKAVKLAAQGQISFKDFFRWLRELSQSPSGLMEVRSRCCPRLQWYLVPISWFLRVLLPVRLDLVFASGLIAGSSGLFFPKVLFDLPSGL